MAIQSPRLSDVQLHLLRFFSEREVSKEETLEIQRLIAKFYAQKADSLMDEIWEQRELNQDKLHEILNSDISSTK